MSQRILLAELQDAGIVLDPDEAIAIAQLVIDACRVAPPAGDVSPPYGPPSPSNVYLERGGAVTCASCQSVPAVSEVAILLQSMLPAGVPRIPGGLRYTIARALLDVDAPPFDSLDDFSVALARYERGDRGAIIRGLLDRAGAMTDGGSAADRRRRAPSAVSELRRQLREADARIYDQQRALDAVGTVTAPPASRFKHTSAIAASLLAGAALIGAGQVMQRRDAPVHRSSRATGTPAVVRSVEQPLPRSIANVAPATKPGAPLAGGERQGSTEAATIKRISRGTSASTATAPRARSQARHPLGWLRKKFVFRADPL